MKTLVATFNDGSDASITTKANYTHAIRGADGRIRWASSSDLAKRVMLFHVVQPSEIAAVDPTKGIIPFATFSDGVIYRRPKPHSFKYAIRFVYDVDGLRTTRVNWSHDMKGIKAHIRDVRRWVPEYTSETVDVCVPEYKGDAPQQEVISPVKGIDITV